MIAITTRLDIGYLPSALVQFRHSYRCVDTIAIALKIAMIGTILMTLDIIVLGPFVTVPSLSVMVPRIVENNIHPPPRIMLQ